jgi:hypothetical protein
VRTDVEGELRQLGRVITALAPPVSLDEIASARGWSATQATSSDAVPPSDDGCEGDGSPLYDDAGVPRPATEDG